MRRATILFAVVLGVITLAICITAIYLMSTTQGCSLQVVP